MKAGLYLAVVTDNNNFFETGKIKVRIKDFYGDKIQFLDRYTSEADLSSGQDSEAYVFSPMGAGNGHGYFSLPTVNEMGVVSFFEGKVFLPVWMGSITLPELYEDGNIKNIFAPNRNPDTNVGYATSQRIKNYDVNDSGFVHRIKTGVFNKFKNKKNVDWLNRETKHLFSANEEQYHIRHYTSWYKKTAPELDNIEVPSSPNEFQEIIVGDTGIVLRIRKGLEDNGETTTLITADSDGIIIKTINGDTSKQNTSFIKLTKAGSITLNASDSQKNTTKMYIDEFGLDVSRNDMTDQAQKITMTANGIKLTSQKIILDTQNIVLGDEGLHLVGTKSTSVLQTEDGALLFPIDGINHSAEIKA